MEDTPRISIDFDDDPTTLEGAWEKMRDARSLSDSRFGEGERQRLLTIEDKSIKNYL